MRSQRIGIFGGSFDPVHTGHLLIADAAVKQCRLDRVFFIPTRRSPHKRSASHASAAHRSAMLRRAIRGRNRFEYDDAEIRRKGVSYTSETLRHIRARFPHASLYLLIGSDNLRTFHAWKDPEWIASEAKLVVYRRWEHPVTQRLLKRWGAIMLKGAEIFISSTRIRHRRSSRRTIRYLVPPDVERYIDQHSLYAGSERKR